MKSLFIIGALLLAGGCGKKKNSQEGLDPGLGSSAMGSSSGAAAAQMGSGPTGATGSDVGSAGSGSAMAAAVDVDVPTETDFEAEAKAKITDKNVDSTLTALEKDLAQ